MTRTSQENIGILNPRVANGNKRGEGQRTRIGSGVANVIDVRRKYGRCAQPWLASGLTYVETMVRLEPNAVVIHKADNGNRHPKQSRGHCR